MANTEKRTISLPAEHAAYIDERVKSGSFASVSEVVRAGLRALQERDDAVERWLREEVAPAYDRVKENPEATLSAQSVFDEIRSRHAAALRKDA